ncbi:MAG: hypothetical protein P3M72_00295 [Candidatus Hodgkinia cicadicola]|nr:MAG: hypothetical protein P3M72_00295 [Candidatus Hodgkinia cicadicola]
MLVVALALVSAPRLAMKLVWTAQAVVRVQMQLGLQTTDADRRLCGLNDCVRFSLKVWAAVLTSWRVGGLPKAASYLTAALVLVLGYKVEMATLALIIAADVFNSVFPYLVYVLVFTSECRFRLRLLAAAPALAPLILYMIHDLVIPPTCYYGSDEPEVLEQAYWPFPSFRLR